MDASHPSTGTLPRQWFRTDEWYNFREDPSPNVGVLLSIDETTYNGGEMGAYHPISWRHPYEGGHSWYTAMGHTIESYSEPFFLEHLAGGILWAADVPPLRSAPLPIPDVETGNIRTGYVVVTPTTNSALPNTTVSLGLVRDGVVQSQAGTTGLPLIMDASMFAEVNPAIQRNLGIAIANPMSNAAILTMTLRGSDGVPSKSRGVDSFGSPADSQVCQRSLSRNRSRRFRWQPGNRDFVASRVAGIAIFRVAFLARCPSAIMGLQQLEVLQYFLSLQSAEAGPRNLRS